VSRRVQLEQGYGGIIEFYPPEGVPDASPAPTVEIVDLVAETAATPDSVSQTATAAEGSREITVTSTTGMVAGRRYWLGENAPLGYEDSAVLINSATVFTLENPLKVGMTSGKVRGHGLRYTVSAADAEDEALRLRAVWRYSIGGIAKRGRMSLDIVEDPFDLVVTEEEIEARAPGWSGQSGARGSWRRYLDAARDDIVLMLEAQKVLAHEVEHRDLLRPAFIYRILYHRHRRDEELSAEYSQLASQAMRDFFRSYHSEFDSVLGS